MKQFKEQDALCCYSKAASVKPKIFNKPETRPPSFKSIQYPTLQLNIFPMSPSCILCLVLISKCCLV